MSESLSKKVVILHARGNDQAIDLVREIGWEASCSVESYTDVEVAPSILNEGLPKSVAEADALIIEASLLHPPTPDAHLALQSLRVVGRNAKTKVYAVDDEGSFLVSQQTLRSLRSQPWIEREPSDEFINQGEFV